MEHPSLIVGWKRDHNDSVVLPRTLSWNTRTFRRLAPRDLVEIHECHVVGPHFPMVIGAECAGTIDALGSGVDTLRTGDDVYTYFSGDQGAYAQYVCVKADDVARKPENLSFIEAAAILVDGITAHQALVDELHVDAKTTVLIAGASGGVGTLAVQIAAKAFGARVMATAGVDAALDCVGKDDNAKTTIEAVRDGGRLAELVGEDVPGQRGITVAHIQSKPSAKRHTRGKIVLVVDENRHVSRGNHDSQTVVIHVPS